LIKLRPFCHTANSQSATTLRGTARDILVMLATLVLASLLMVAEAIENQPQPCGCVEAVVSRDNSSGDSGQEISTITAWTLLQVNLINLEGIITFN